MAISTTELINGSIPYTVYISSSESAVTFMSLCNRTAGAVLCDIHIVPNGDVPDNSNLFIKDLEVVAGDTFIIYQGGEKIVLDDSDTIQVVSDTSNAISAIVSHIQV